MKLLNNVRITAISEAPREREELLAALNEVLGIDLQAHTESEDLKHEQFETLYSFKIWLDRQPLLRPVQDNIIDGMSLHDKKLLWAQADVRFDERGFFYFRIDKSALLSGTPKLVEKGDVVQFRCNLAAHPKNPDTLRTVLKELLGGEAL